MARYSGKIGFASQKRIDDRTEEVIIEQVLYGDILTEAVKSAIADTINPQFSIGNSISLVANPFAFENAYAIRYAVYLGKRWSVAEVKINAPRIILRLGGIYNGPEA